MFGLLWISLAVVLLGTKFSDTDWFTILDYRKIGIPGMSWSLNPVCYYFNMTQPCSATAFKNLLGVAPDTDISSITLSMETCKIVQRGMRPLAEWISSDVFGNAIATAPATMTNFELITQIWALQAGYIELKMNQTLIDFANVLNGVSDWSTVGCGYGVLLYGVDSSVPLPDFVTDKDCEILSVSMTTRCASTCTSISPLNLVKHCCAQPMKPKCCMDLVVGCNYNTCASDLKERCCIASEFGSCCTGQ